MYRHSKVVPVEFFYRLGIDPIRLGGNDRRRTANGLCENWLRDRGLRLGPDYRVYVNQRPRGLGGVTYDVHIDIVDDQVALLWKLTWGGR